jgi:hypothetical protein
MQCPLVGFGRFGPNEYSFTKQPSLLYHRVHFACTIFTSPKHDFRPVVLAAGGWTEGRAEIWDYTVASSSWVEIEKSGNGYAPRALPSISGYGAYYQTNEVISELSCEPGKSCSWKKLEKQLEHSVDGAVAMYLPSDYDCN